MAPRKVRRVVIYARISVTSEESVSVERQVEACSKYAEARGWAIIAVITDDGLSATHNKPETRKGWRQMLALQEPYDAVVVWKIDRLARRVLDFLHADQALQERGAAVVCVEQPIDMTSTTGRAFATMLAVFAEMEADAISSRVAAARDYLLRNGRLPGGTVPYGFMKIRNPVGPGFALAQDPTTIGYVRGMIERALAGESIYSVMKWLDAVGAPLPKASQKNRKRAGWHYSTVERILRSPVLAGMVPFNPGNASKSRGDDVLRDHRGLPVVDESIALISTHEHRRLLTLLDNRDSPQAKPRGGKQVTSTLLSGLANCGHCDRKMYRGTNRGRPVLVCPGCFQTISTSQVVPYLEKRLLRERGELRAISIELTSEDDAATLADVEAAIRDTAAKMTEDDADVSALADRLAGLKELRAKARDTRVRHTVHARTTSVSDDWHAAQNDDERRTVLLGQVEKLRIVRGKVGRYLDPARVQLTWTHPVATTPDMVGTIGEIRLVPGKGTDLADEYDDDD